jgi:hypothetical protein
MVVGGVLVWPMFRVLDQAPGLEQRLDLLNQPLAELRQGNVTPVFDLTLRALGMYVVQGEQDWLYNVYGRPIFDPVTAVFFLAGLLLSLWRWRQPAHGLLLIWFFAGTAPAMLAPPAASLTHTIAAQPAAFILLAWGVCTVAGWLWQRHRPGGRLLPAAVVLYGVAVSGEAYFHQWANAPEVRELYQGGITAVADAVVAEPPLGPVAIGAPFISYWQPWNAVNFDLAVPADVSQVRWFNPAGAWVWPTGSELATYYFPADPLGPQIYEPELLALFEANAQPLATTSADYVAYRLADLAWLDERIEVLAGATAVQWPPDQTQLPAPALPLMFGRRLSLLAVSTPAIAADVTIRIVTYWQVLEADPTPLVAFVHVTGDGLDIWGQQDWLDVRMAGLQSGDRFAQVHIVPINPDTPAGRYQMQLGLYRPDTLERLPIIAADGQLADRVFVGAVTIDE